MNLQQARSGQDAHGDYNQVSVENPSEILDELSVLLEEHAPSWYSENSASGSSSPADCPQRFWSSCMRYWKIMAPLGTRKSNMSGPFPFCELSGSSTVAWTSKVEPNKVRFVADCFGPRLYGSKYRDAQQAETFVESARLPAEHEFGVR